jgi:hypothetical protein
VADLPAEWQYRLAASGLQSKSRFVGTAMVYPTLLAAISDVAPSRKAQNRKHSETSG